MANYMAEVAKMLGVELGEEFEIKYPRPVTVKTTAVFSENGFRIVDTDEYILTPNRHESILHSLLKGDLTVKRKPWKPENDDMFFVVAYDGSILTKYWDDECTTHKTYYKIGNCYRHFNEAKDYREKWMAFYASDEILEV